MAKTFVVHGFGGSWYVGGTVEPKNGPIGIMNLWTSFPDLPVAYIFGTKLPGKPMYQVSRHQVPDNYSELEDGGLYSGFMLV